MLLLVVRAVMKKSLVPKNVSIHSVMINIVGIPVPAGVRF